MDIYDVQNTQYALSVLDEIESQTNISQATRRVPIFLFNNHYISGDFILKQEGQTTLPVTVYSRNHPQILKLMNMFIRKNTKIFKLLRRVA